MANVYEVCPTFENERYLLRFIEENDANELLKVYADQQAVPFFNSDNCNGDDFYYRTAARMQEALDFWFLAYQDKAFVRWSIVAKAAGAVIGTIELFHRDGMDAFTNCGLLRLDLRSDHEETAEIANILTLIIAPTFELFQCDKIATKGFPQAQKRLKALEQLKFSASKEPLIGHDGTPYSDYWLLQK